MGKIVDAFLSYRIKSKSKGVNDSVGFWSPNVKDEKEIVSKEWDILFEKEPDLSYLIQVKFNEFMFTELPTAEIK